MTDNVDLATLGEDDDFEEFIEEEWKDEETEQAANKDDPVWNDDWDDDDIEDDFTKELRAELEKQGHKIEAMQTN